MELFDELKALHRETDDGDFKPDGMLYGAVIDALTKARSSGDSSLRLAVQMIDKMEMQHDIGDIDTGPDRYAYTNLLHGISKSRVDDGISLAEDLMQRMDTRSKQLDDESIRPDTTAYTTLIQIYANSGRPDSVQNALRWFDKMERLYEDGDVRSKPNKVTYTALINCWRRSGLEEAGEEAEKILSAMESKCRGDLDLKPDAFVYAAVIDAWARCKSHDKAARARSVYQRMKKQFSDGNMESRPNNVIVSTP